MSASLLLLLALLYLPADAASLAGALRPPPRLSRTVRASALCVPPPSAGPEVQVLCAAGLEVQQAEEIWQRRPPGRLPAPARQAALVDWLLREPLADAARPAAALRTALLSEPRLLLRAGRIEQLVASWAALRAALSELSGKRLAATLSHNAQLLLLTPEEVEERRSEIGSLTGLDAEELSSALSAAPRLLLAPMPRLRSRAEWLSSRLGICGGEGGGLRLVVSRAPLVLLLSLSRSLEPRLALFESLGVGGELVGRLVLRSPRVLHCPMAHLTARLQWLQDSGVASGSELPGWLAAQTDFFAVPSRVCEARLQWLAGVCGAEGEPDEAAAAAMLREEPQILTQSAEQLQLRVELWTGVLGGAPSDLSSVPHLFTSDLGRTVLLRHAYCLATGKVDVLPTDLLLKDTPSFCSAVVGCTEEELRAFEAEGKHLQLFAAI